MDYVTIFSCNLKSVMVTCFNTCFFFNSQESRTEESPSYINVTLDHKTSHVGQFFEIEIYAPSES